MNTSAFGYFLSKVVVSGAVSAITALPLSIGFALMAGVPPSVMVLASVYSGVFNALLAGRYGVGGPNTAVAMLTGAALMPFAPPESDLYMGYVFALCVLAGAYQLLFAALLRRVDIMDYVSTTVIDGVTFGIGAVFVLTSLWMAAGLAQPGGAQWSVFHALMSVDRVLDGTGNNTALAISGATLAAGMLAWQVRRLKRFGILIGILAGVALASWLEHRSGAPAIEHIGWLSLPLLQPTVPDFRQVSWPILFNLAAGPAFSIALVGALQTLTIAKSIRDTDEEYRPAREVLCQGLQHLFMGFFGGTPVSNSFNKSALKRDLGGGRDSQLFAVAVTLALVYLFGDFVAHIPLSALGAALILVGLGMLNPRRYARHLTTRPRQAMFLLPALLVVAVDIQSAIYFGVALSVAAHFADFSRAEISLSRDGDRVRVGFAGVFFFVSDVRMEKLLRRHFPRTGGSGDARSLEVDLRAAHLVALDHLSFEWLRPFRTAGIAITVLIRPAQEARARLLLVQAGLPESLVQVGLPTDQAPI